MILQSFMNGVNEPHKRHLEILRQIILGGGGGSSPSPGPGPEPGPEPEPTPEIVEENDVTFYDWDGVILYSYTAYEALQLEELPEIPDRSSIGLYDGQWNWTLSEMKECVNDIKMCCIGAGYETVPNRTIHDYPPTYIDVQMDIVKKFDLLCEGGGTFDIDWGDGAQTHKTPSSNTTISHTYQDTDKHTVKIEPSNAGTYNFSIPDSSGWCVLSVRLGQAFPNILGGQNLESINIPPSLTNLTNRMNIGAVYHNQCPKLKHLTLPRGIGTSYSEQPMVVGGWGVPGGMTISTTYNMYKASGGSFMPGLYSLLHNFMMPLCGSSYWPSIGEGGKTVRDSAHGFPTDVKSFPPANIEVLATTNPTIKENTGIRKLRCGSSVTKLNFEAMAHTEGSDIYVPSTVTSIEGGRYGIDSHPIWCARSIHLQSTTPPSVVKNEDQKACRIYVPQEAVYIYKQATNWSVYSDYIFPENEEVVW